MLAHFAYPEGEQKRSGVSVPLPHRIGWAYADCPVKSALDMEIVGETLDDAAGGATKLPKSWAALPGGLWWTN